MMEILSTKKLMEGVKRSDERSFRQLYDRLWEPMFFLALGIMGKEDDAKDVIQEVWINFWNNRAAIRNDNVEGYLFRAVRNKVYNTIRNSRHRENLIQEFIGFWEMVPTNSVEETINYMSTQKIIIGAVKRLPEKCRQVFIMSRYDGLSNHEIAIKLNISKRTVETHISNALKTLKQYAVRFVLLFFYFFS